MDSYEFIGEFPAYYHGKNCVILPCQNRNEFLRHSLPAWFSQTYRRFELVVVDYSSETSVLADIEPIAKKYGIKIDIDPPLTPERYTEFSGLTLLQVKNTPEWNMSHALNYAITRTTSDVVTIAGCDTTPDPAYLELVMQIVAPKTVASVFCGRVSFPRQAWSHINGYTELCTGWGWEDCDFRYRLKRAGYRLQELDVMLCPSVSHMSKRGNNKNGAPQGIGVTDKPNRKKCEEYCARFGIIGNYCLPPGQESPIPISPCDTNIITWAPIENVTEVPIIATSICYTGVKDGYVFRILPSCGPSDIDFTADVQQIITGAEQTREVHQGVDDLLADINTGVFQWN